MAMSKGKCEWANIHQRTYKAYTFMQTSVEVLVDALVDDLHTINETIKNKMFNDPEENNISVTIWN